jgi:hypothetical protein
MQGKAPMMMLIKGHNDNKEEFLFGGYHAKPFV